MRRFTFSVIGFTALVLAACSGSDGVTGPHDGGPTGGSAGAGGGSSGAGGLTSNGGASTGGVGAVGAGAQPGSGGAGGSAATPLCPTAPPAAASSCMGVPDSCFYEDCGGPGRVAARCSNGAWVLETGACGDTTCGPGSLTCAAGQACVQRAGGAVFTDCAANHCNGGPVQCDCIDGCSLGCWVTGTVYGGIFVSCNTCPSGQCP
jgi:hypothetical protein